MTQIYANYPNKWFVETGTFMGDGVEAAYRAGFRNIKTIEIRGSTETFIKRFKDHEGLTFFSHIGDSKTDLVKLLKSISEPATFWLDAHGGSHGCSGGTPVLRELDQIADHPIKTHTILVDDCRTFTPILIEEIKAKIVTINPNYKITFLNPRGVNPPEDILVAVCEQQ